MITSAYRNTRDAATPAGSGPPERRPAAESAPGSSKRSSPGLLAGSSPGLAPDAALPAAAAPQPSADLAEFLGALTAATARPGVFNPWAEYDPACDLSPDSPSHRLAHLQAYLAARQGRARWLAIAEAVGYRGAKFSGVPMTSERALLAPEEGPGHFFPGTKHRTSRLVLAGRANPSGMIEPTASVLWPALLVRLDPLEWVNWNVFAWHPHPPGLPLANRTPTPREILDGLAVLEAFLRLFPDTRVIAVGRKSEFALERLGRARVAVRHPANGGVGRFRAQVHALLTE